MSKALRKLKGSIAKSNTVMIFINQIREKIGGFSFTPGPQTTTSGGRALKFFSSVRMEVKRIGSVKQGEEIIGNEVSVKVTKNKVAPPFKEARFSVLYGKGISKVGEVLDAATKLDIVAKSGAWFSYGDRKLGQGKINVENLLKEDKELYNKLEAEVLAKIKPDYSVENEETEPVETEEKTLKTSKKEKVDEIEEIEEIEIEDEGLEIE